MFVCLLGCNNSHTVAVPHENVNMTLDRVNNHIALATVCEKSAEEKQFYVYWKF